MGDDTRIGGFMFEIFEYDMKLCVCVGGYVFKIRIC